MGATWHWYRFEYALMRGSIHCHGLAKLKGDPGLCDLSQIALNGFNAQEKLTSNDFELEHFDNLQRAVYEGKVSENKICDYVDSIVTAENPSPPHEGEWVKPKIHPCKKKFKHLKDSELDDDYANLVNSVQRHSVCNSAYCLRKENNGTQSCGSNFLLMNVKAHILSMKRSIVPKRQAKISCRHSRFLSHFSCFFCF